MMGTARRFLISDPQVVVRTREYVISIPGDTDDEAVPEAVWSAIYAHYARGGRMDEVAESLYEGATDGMDPEWEEITSGGGDE